MYFLEWLKMNRFSFQQLKIKNLRDIFLYSNKSAINYLYPEVLLMERIKDLDSPQPIPGLEKPPVPWEERKRAGMTAGELLTEKVGELIED